MNKVCMSLVIVLLLTMFGAVSGPVYAKTTQWTGGIDAVWNEPGNWNSGIPINDDTVQFDTASTANLSTTCDLSLTGITIEVINPSGNVSIDISGIGALEIAAIDMDSAQDDLALATNVNSFTIAAAAAFNITSGRTITVTESIVNGGNNLTVQGAGALTINAGGDFSGTGQLIMSGTGTITINTDTAFTGTLRINSGTVDLTTATAPLAAGDIDLNGGTLKLSQGINAANWNRTVDVIGSSAIEFNAAGNVIDAAITVSAAQVLTLQGGQAASITAGITGAGGLTLNMSANQVITVSTTGCDYTGDTTITSGNLTGGATNMLTDSGTYSLANDANALMTLGGAETIGKLTGGGTTGGNIINGGNTITVTQSTDGTYGGVISGNGGLLKGGAGKLTLTGNSSYLGTTSVSAGTLNMQHANAAGTAGAVNVSAGASLELQGGIAVGAKQLNLTGGGANELVSVSGVNSWAGACSLMTASVDIVVSANAFTMSGIISGSTATVDLVKSGAGELALTGDNTYTGDLVVNAGTCTLGHLDAFGSGDMSLGGGTLKLGVAIDAINWDPAITLTGSAAIDADFAGSEIDTPIDIDANTLTVSGDESITLSGVIGTAADAGGLTVDMTDVNDIVTVTNANLYTGATTITVGTLNVRNNTGTGTTAGGVTVAADARLQIQNDITVGTEALTVHGGAANEFVNVSGTNSWAGTISLQTATPDFETSAGTLTLSGIISEAGGAYGITKGGTGTLVLSGDNSYTGAINVNGGKLNLQHDTAAGTTAGGVAVAAGAGLQLNNSVTIGAAETLTLNGDGGGVVELESVSGSNRWHGTVTLATAAVDIVSTAGTLYLSNTISGQNMTFDCNTGDINATGVIGGGAITVTQSGTGTLLLGGDNTYTGVLSVGAGGTVELAHANAFGTGAGTLTIGADGTLSLDETINADDWDQPITLAGAATIQANYSDCVIDEDITNAAGLLTFEGTEHLTVSSTIGPNAGGIKLDMTNEFDTITLTNANTYTGSTNIVSGTLNLQNDTAAGTTAGGVDITAATGGRLELEGGITVGGETLWINGDGGATVEVNNVSGVNAWNGAVTLATNTVGIKSTAGTLTFGSTMSGQNVEFDCNTGDITVTGAIGAGGGQTLTKTGTGTLTLNGADNYTGGTTVNAGTIVFNGVDVGATAITANNAGTRVEGTGTIPGTLTMNDGTILAPGGTAVGTLTVNGAVTLNAESKYEVTVTGADPDKIVAGDVFTATGNTPNVVIQAGFNTAGLSLPETIIDVTGAYTALDESGLEVGWDIDDAPVGGLIRITSTGGPPVIPTLNEWGMIILSFLLAAFAVRTIRSRRYNVA